MSSVHQSSNGHSAADDAEPKRALPTREQALTLISRAKQIFISYSHSDLRSAHLFRKATLRLRPGQSQETVFLDQENLAPGSNVSPEDIDRRLRTSDLFVVLCGADTAVGGYVNREITQAVRLRDAQSLTILPVILAPRVRLPPALDFHVQGIFLTTLFPEIARRRLVRRISFGVLVALVAVAGGVAYRFRVQRQASVLEAQSQRLEAQARATLDADPQLAVLLAVEALRAAAGTRPLASTQNVLRDALEASPGYGLGEQNGPVVAAVFTPDGRRLATGSVNGTVALWDVTSHDPASPPRVLRGHTGPITSLAIDRAGRLLVSGSKDGTTLLWKLTDQAPSQVVLSGGGTSISSVAIGGDGRCVVAGRGTSASLWRLDNGMPTSAAMTFGRSDEVRSVAIDPAGRWLVTVSCSASLRKLDALDRVGGDRPLGPSTTCVKSVAFSSDGRWLLTGSQDNVLRIWDLADLRAQPIAVNGLSGMSFSGIDLVAVLPDGSAYVTGYGDGSVQLWDWSHKTRPKPGLVLQGHRGRVASVAIGGDGSWLATRGEEGTIRLWDLLANSPEKTGRVLRSHVGVLAMAIGPGSWLASGSVSGAVRLERLPPQHERDEYMRYGDPTEISADSRWVATAVGDGDVWLWDLSKDNPTETPALLRGHSKPVSRLAISPDGRRLATASYDRTGWVWDLKAQDIARSRVPLPSHGRDIRSLVFSGDSRWIIAGRDDGTVVLRDLTAGDGAPPREIRHAPEGDIRGIASPDGQWLITGGSRGPIRVWRLSGHDIEASVALGKEGDLMWPLAVTANSHWLVTGSDGCRARLWELTSRDIAKSSVEIKVCAGDSFGLDVSDDGHWLVTGGEDGSVRLWDLTNADSAREPRLIGRHEGRVSRVVLARGSGRLITGGVDGTVRLWNLTARDVERSVLVLRHEAEVTSINVTSEVHWLVTGDAAGVVRLWDLRAKDVAASAGTLTRHGSRVAWVTSSGDGKWLVSLGTDGSVNLSNLTTEWLLRRARQAAGRNLSADEWTKYFPQQPYHPTFADLPVPTFIGSDENQHRRSQ